MASLEGDGIAGRRRLGGDAGRFAPLWRTVRCSHGGRIACQADKRVSKPPPNTAASARECAQQDRSGRQARRQNTPRRTGQRLASFAKRANKTRQRANTAMLVASFPSKEEQSKRNANKKEKHFPTLPSPSLFPFRAFLFSLSFSFSFFSPFFPPR